MNKGSSNPDTPTANTSSYLERVQKYIKEYAENCRYSFNSMFQI